MWALCHIFPFCQKPTLKSFQLWLMVVFLLKLSFFRRAVRRCSVKKVFLKFLQNLLEQPCRNLFLFSCEVFEIFKNIYFYRPPLVAVSVFLTKIGLSLHKKMKFSIKVFFGKCDQTRNIFCAVYKAKKKSK